MRVKKQKPATSTAGAAAQAERRARLAAALRENLRKRKLQKRGRDEAAVDQVGAGYQPLEGEPEVK
jgi:hypothetical protein